MTNNSVQIATLATWGFLVGFVGWGACFRLIHPIAKWLIGTQKNDLLFALAQFLVMVFLIAANFIALSLMPIFFEIANSAHSARGIEWRNAAGTTFVASLVGFFTLGIMKLCRKLGSGL
jgi:Na+/melibiose symporter-like transporter